MQPSEIYDAKYGNVMCSSFLLRYFRTLSKERQKQDIHKNLGAFSLRNSMINISYFGACADTIRELNQIQSFQRTAQSSSFKTQNACSFLLICDMLRKL